MWEAGCEPAVGGLTGLSDRCGVWHVCVGGGGGWVDVEACDAEGALMVDLMLGEVREARQLPPGRHASYSPLPPSTVTGTPSEPRSRPPPTMPLPLPPPPPAAVTGTPSGTCKPWPECTASGRWGGEEESEERGTGLLCTRAGWVARKPLPSLLSCTPIVTVLQTKPVHVYRLCTEGTVEERVQRRAEQKLYLDQVGKCGGKWGGVGKCGNSE